MYFRLSILNGVTKRSNWGRFEAEHPNTGTRIAILTPKIYDEYPRHFYTRVPPAHDPAKGTRKEIYIALNLTTSETEPDCFFRLYQHRWVADVLGFIFGLFLMSKTDLIWKRLSVILKIAFRSQSHMGWLYTNKRKCFSEPYIVS